MKHPEGIKSLHVTVPVGAQVTMGRKGPGGRGISEKDKGMFHFVSPFEDSDHVRPYLPQFNEYHRLKPEHRRLIKANLVYGTVPQSFTYRLRMREFPKHEPEPRARPKLIPVCEGNGKDAVRWQRKDDEVKQIVCPDERCQYRQVEPPLCRPFSEILFRPRWDKMDLPSPVCRLRSETSWSSAANIAGFFRQLQEQANEMGLPDATFYGFPFTIQLVQRTSAAKRRKWYAVVLTPETDIVEFFRWQRERIRELQAPLPLAAIPDLRDREDEQEPSDPIEGVVLGDSDDV